MRRFALLAALPTVSLTLAACGGDNNGGDAASTTPAATNPAATTAASTPAASSGSTLDASSGKVTITASEFKFSADEIDAKAGKLAITLKNDGQAPHEFIVLKTDAAPDALPVSGGRVSEDDSVGEVSEVEPGKTGKATLKLSPGTYVYVCNIPGHYQGGMNGKLVVQ